MSRLVRWWLLAAVGAGCAGSDALTEIVVVLDSDIEALDAIAVGTDNFEDTRVASANLGPGERQLPRSLGIVHEGGPYGPIAIVAFGLDADERVLVNRRAQVFFVPEQVRMLRMELTESCIDVYETCPDDETCVGGECVHDEGELEPWTGELPESRL